MPGSATTPGRPGTRAHAPVRIAFHLRNSVGTRDINLCEAQWLAYVLPCRRFAVALQFSDLTCCCAVMVIILGYPWLKTPTRSMS